MLEVYVPNASIIWKGEWSILKHCFIIPHRQHRNSAWIYAQVKPGMWAADRPYYKKTGQPRIFQSDDFKDGVLIGLWLKKEITHVKKYRDRVEQHICTFMSWPVLARRGFLSVPRARILLRKIWESIKTTNIVATKVFRLHGPVEHVERHFLTFYLIYFFPYHILHTVLQCIYV